MRVPLARTARFYRQAFQLQRGRLPEHNRELFDHPDSVESYRPRDGFTLCERYLCDRYLGSGRSVLDVGVGTGRTTRELSKFGSYVGIDYSVAMVEECRRRYPDRRFEVMDAADLSAFDDGSFDSIVFSYNGIDYLYPDVKRAQFLSEAHRVLSGDGVLLFSTHNARAAVSTKERNGGFRSALEAGLGTARRLAMYVPQRAFWRGTGYVLDPRYGGLVVHHATPRHVRSELEAAGFKLLEMAAQDHPTPIRPWISRWIYYASVKGTARHDGAPQIEHAER